MRHALVTGGGSGIGLAVAHALSRRGFALTLAGRDAGRVSAAAAGLAHAQALACDVTDTAQVGRMVEAAVERVGPVSVLVNNAGVVCPATFARQSDADWEAMWRTNVMGAVHCIRAVLPAMRSDPGGGRIVNIASTASLKGYSQVSGYVATKHALLGLTRALALELASTAVTVNAVCPGYADTEIIREAVGSIVRRTGRTASEARAVFSGANPQGRLIDPKEVADAVCWLVGDGARSVTGQALVVAGGEVM
ncbi:SDR family oxidoreductase [Phenylobacterium sp.]|uniref:SDR family NAD(P)-dependent oxidoreductase n=1 Tax=Phenylobacterium sp. TaxID=1871053 RepID=UPI00301C588E